MSRTEYEVKCAICNRDVPNEYLEKHHLIPKSRKGKKTIDVCINCGKQLHRIFTIKEMEKKYNTVEMILSDERIQKWVEWISKKTNFHVPKGTKKRRN